MARFLFAVFPFPGHINPSIAVAHALHAAGHAIAFYTGGGYRETLEREGWACFPFDLFHQRIVDIVGEPDPRASGADDSSLYRRLMQYQSEPFRHNVLERSRGLVSVYLRSVVGPIPEQVADVQAVLAAWRPDVVVCDPDLWGPSLILPELQHVPVAILSYYLTCLIPGRTTSPAGLGLPLARTWVTRVLAGSARLATDLVMLPVRRATDAMRRRYGLPPLSMRIHSFMGQLPLYLVAGVPELDRQRQDLPPSVHYVGPCSWDAGESETALPWLDQEPSQPLVYVSEGSTYVHAPLVLRAAASGLANLPLRALLATGIQRGLAGFSIGPLAPNIHVERWVPQAAVLARASVFVTHGGATSIMSALLAGVPLVVVPLQWEQSDNAQRIVEAGAGLRLDPRSCTPTRLREAVERVLADPSYRRAAQRLATACAQAGGASRAAELLVALTDRERTT